MMNDLTFRGKPINLLVEKLKAGDTTTLLHAAEALGDLGNQMVRAVSIIRDALRSTILTTSDPEVRRTASESLAQVGPQSQSPIPVLIANVKDPVDVVRWSSASALGEIGAAALAALPALTGAALHDPVARVRVEAAVAIWRIDRRSRRVLRPLIDALTEPDELIRWIAADCLGDIGKDASDAIPSLHQALQLHYSTRLIQIGVATALDRIEAA